MIPEAVLKQFYYPNLKPEDRAIHTSDFSDIIDNLEPDKCDYIVINSPGYELYHVAGARETIRQFKPKILIALNAEFEFTAVSEIINFLSNVDIDYDYMINVDHFAETKQVYMYSWINHGTRIASKPSNKRYVGEKAVGSLSELEIKSRDRIRSRQIPPSGGTDPDVYVLKVMPGHTLKFKRSKIDPWNSWFEFSSETNVRSKFWYPNIAKGDVVVDAGAGWGSYAITAALLGATAYAYDPNPVFIADMMENVKLNGLLDKVFMFKAGLSDHDHYTDWDELKDVHMLSLDEHLKLRLDKHPIDYIKIDVEGQELEVLKGARQTIINDHPKILMEAHLIYNKNMIADAAEYIMKLVDGYQEVVYDCIPSGDTIYVYFSK